MPSRTPAACRCTTRSAARTGEPWVMAVRGVGCRRRYGPRRWGLALSLVLGGFGLLAAMSWRGGVVRVAGDGWRSIPSRCR